MDVDAAFPKEGAAGLYVEALDFRVQNEFVFDSAQGQEMGHGFVQIQGFLVFPLFQQHHGIGVCGREEIFVLQIAFFGTGALANTDAVQSFIESIKQAIPYIVLLMNLKALKIIPI